MLRPFGDVDAGCRWTGLVCPPLIDAAAWQDGNLCRRGTSLGGGRRMSAGDQRFENEIGADAMAEHLMSPHSRSLEMISA
jgi:hypothetical protein